MARHYGLRLSRQAIDDTRRMVRRVTHEPALPSGHPPRRHVNQRREEVIHGVMLEGVPVPDESGEDVIVSSGEMQVERLRDGKLQEASHKEEVYNAGSTALSSGTRITAVRDHYSGKWIGAAVGGEEALELGCGGLKFDEDGKLVIKLAHEEIDEEDKNVSGLRFTAGCELKIRGGCGILVDEEGTQVDVADDGSLEFTEDEDCQLMLPNFHPNSFNEDIVTNVTCTDGFIAVTKKRFSVDRKGRITSVTDL